MNTLIFDFDGTLADTVKLSHQVMNELAVQFNFNTITEDDVRQLKELPALQVLKSMGIAKYKVPFVMAAGKKAIFKRIGEVHLKDGFQPLLDKCREHSRLGIVSTNSRKNVDTFLTNHQIPFDFVYADAKLTGKARLLKKVVKKQQSDKGRTLYIGDEIRDIKAAHKAGLKVIAVTWGYNTKAALSAAGPDYLVESLRELEQAVDEFCNAN